MRRARQCAGVFAELNSGRRPGPAAGLPDCLSHRFAAANRVHVERRERRGVVANAAIVPAGNGGAIDVYVSDTTELVIDINGYFAPYTGDGALSLYIRPPSRVMDTRAGQGANGSVGPPSLAANETRTVDLRTGRCYLPEPKITTKPELIAYLVNATAVPKSSLGYLTLWPFWHRSTNGIDAQLLARRRGCFEHGDCARRCLRQD